MPGDRALEFRLELYLDADLTSHLAEQVSALLAHRWPEAWDVKLPPRASVSHPAEWHAVVPLPDGSTAEMLHRELAGEIRALDPAHQVHFRTRWAFQESPNHQEVYEEHWGSKGN